MSKALHLAAATNGHEELFMARYERLQKWALHLSAGDQGAADDLLQEAFVQFTLTSPDLRAVENIDAYLFGLLRILHLSQLRRTKNRARLLRMVLDYDAAALGLRAADPRDQLIMREQLQRVCRYACSRKETSKAGSVLLLRYFLGYYPGEIARLGGCKRPAVEERLRIARAEAKAYLDEPAFLRAPGGAAAGGVVRCDLSQTVDDFLRGLRHHIYQSRGGDCLDARQWARLYREGGARDCATLAHLSSCPRCLDIVNELLGLPLLGERHPVDTIGKEPSGRDGGGDDGPAGGRGGADYKAGRCRQRAREVFEHRPEQLCVAVNGYLVGSHRVSGRHNEQTLHIAEAVEFVEVFSEQDVRLLVLQVGEQPPEGPFRHTARIPLNDGRELEANLSLNYPTSSLQVVYRDPLRQAEGARAVRPSDVSEAAGPVDSSPVAGGASAAKPRAAERGFDVRGLRDAAGRLGRLFTNYGWWLRPGVLTAVLCLLILTATLFFIRWRGGTVAAAELLGRSAAAERAAAGDKSKVNNRVFYLECRGKAGEPALRRRVEVWQSAERGLTVRRVYDEREQLVIAEWLAADGTRTVYSPGSKPATGVESQPDAGHLLEPGESWRLNPSTETFLGLTGQAEGLRVEEAPETYTVSYQRGGAAALPGGVVEAALVIRKVDLRGVELRVVARRGGELREYRFVESQFSRQPTAAAPISVFEIDGARAASPTVRPEPSTREPEAAPLPISSPRSNDAPTASAELEVEVNYLLYGVRANLGEQVSVRRTPGGRLRVEALAETAGRKAEILDALAPVAGNPAVEIEVNTVAEALRRRGAPSAAATSVLEVEVREDTQGVDAELRRHFARRFGDGERADEAVRQLSRRVTENSRRAVQHAAALRKFAASFPLGQSASLEGAAREKLLAIIQSQARGYEQNVRALRQEVLPLAPAGTDVEGGAGAAAISNDAELRRAVERLLRLSRSNDEAVRSAFTLSAEGQSLAQVTSPRFWAALGEAEALARAINRAYQK